MSDSLFDFLPGAVEPSYDYDDLARGAIETSKAKVTVTAHEHWLKTTTLAESGHRFRDQFSISLE
jgi:hypothetical protein